MPHFHVQNVLFYYVTLLALYVYAPMKQKLLFMCNKGFSRKLDLLFMTGAMFPICVLKTQDTIYIHLFMWLCSKKDCLVEK